MRLKKQIQYSIIFFFGIVLILPFLQGIYQIVKLPPLYGYIEKSEKPELSTSNWLNGEYQVKEEKYLNDNFGLRNFFIRFNNQIDYYLFKKAHANSVVVGKNNYLFETRYLDAASGRDYIGEDSINRVVERIKLIQAELEKRNKTFLIVFTPGKGTFYNEYAPENYQITDKPTNYKTYKRLLVQNNINFIDFNSYFLKLKEKSKYPLYPKYGIHWSYYGMAISLDSILKKVESMRNISLQDMTMRNIEIQEAKKDDDDMIKGMNLLQNPKPEQLAYPEIVFTDLKDNDVKPSLLVIGDSFYWKILELTKNTFEPNDFWYYNTEKHPRVSNINKLVIDLNFDEEINNHDIIILFFTETNLNVLGWGFIEKAYSYLKYGKFDSKADFMARVNKMIENIRSNKEWFAIMEKKAKDLNITVDSALMRDATWMVQQGKK
ncbi:MAG TPA: hypothetical protein VK172_07695 [Lentimicrobium sp.]|nr:hypothetical protein [Lentimicrobium sp.]